MKNLNRQQKDFCAAFNDLFEATTVKINKAMDQMLNCIPATIENTIDVLVPFQPVDKPFTLESLQSLDPDYTKYQFTVTNFQIKETLTLYLNSCKQIGTTQEDNCSFEYYEISTFSDFGILSISYLNNGEIVPALWAKTN